MALFARRVLQRVLNENAHILTLDQAENICALLNHVSDNYLSTEWEQVILNAASKLADVDYEKKFSGGRVPDLYFKSHQPKIEFVAEITAPSDRKLHAENPKDPLHEEFWRCIRKRKLKLTGGISIEIDSYPNTIYRGSKQKVRLKIPKEESARKKRIFNAAFHEFLTTIARFPNQRHEHHCMDEITGVHFVYDPRQRGTSTGKHQSYDIAYVIDRNPVYGALKSKGDQLKAAGYKGLCGIFLCDGGSQVLRASRSSASFNAQEMIEHFFRQFDSVAFVVTFIVRESHAVFQLTPTRGIETKLYVSPKWEKDEGVLLAVIRKLHRLLPKPVENPENALRRLKQYRGISGRYWGQLVSNGETKISARLLLEILAGVKTIRDFEKEFGMQPDENPFKRMLASRRLISRVAIEYLTDDDDDVATFTFGKLDAAIGPFEIKKT